MCRAMRQGVRPTNHGMSVYGIYLAGCSNYRIVRCEVNAGRAPTAPTHPMGIPEQMEEGGGGGQMGGQSQRVSYKLRYC